MNRKWSYAAAGVILAGAIFTGALFIGMSMVDTDGSGQDKELEELKSKARHAAVIQQVSRQMENIAYQQKEISDRQRMEAQRQSAEARKMRLKAEMESEAARRAERNARKAAAEADTARAQALIHQKEAEIQRDAANSAKKYADTLTYLILGRALGSMAMDKYESGQRELSSSLAYTGWHLVKRYGGNTYQTEIFGSLNTCSESMRRYSSDKGGAVTSICRYGKDECISVTDYGEIERVNPHSGAKEILLQDKQLDFRGVCTDGEFIYAVSLHGPLICLKSGAVNSVDMPSGRYLGMEHFGGDHLLVFSEDFVLLFGMRSKKVEDTMRLDGKLSAVASSGGRSYLFFSDGSSAYINADFTYHQYDLKTGDAVTAAGVDDATGTLYIGLENGRIKAYDGSGFRDIVSGHSSRITCLLPEGDILISTAFDRCTEIVNVSSQYDFSSVSVRFQGWPLCICRNDGSEVLIGTSDGMLNILDTSTDSMAASLAAKGGGLMNREVWDEYVGESIPYPEFK